MRTISAIILLFVFLLYHLGYYGIYLSTRYQLDNAWEDKIVNEQVAAEQLFVASVPLSIPYQPDQNRFHPASGTFEINGKFYRIVKQRYAKDTLHIVYVNDTTLEDLNQSLEDWLASITQKPTSEKGGHQLWKSVSKDFLLLTVMYNAEPIVEDDAIPFGNYLQFYYNISAPVPSPPPEV